MKCDAYGVWGSRTQSSLLYSSRNLDYQSNSGINKYKLITFVSLKDPKYYANNNGLPIGGKYVTMGFAFGIAALGGMNVNGITASEMNLDNNVVTFRGVPFPLRLRYVLEQSTNLNQAMQVWTSTNNTNSFNFLIGSATDAVNGNNQGGAYALETIRGYTAVFPANSPVEQNAMYNCTADPNCQSWTNQTSGMVQIGFPLPEAVWRSNHGFNPRVMNTQEPLFYDTIFRYNLMHDLFDGLQKEGTLIGDDEALGIVSTLGTKGSDVWTECDPSKWSDGSNVMSIVYAAGERPSASQGYFYVAWEAGGINTNATWRPAACATYIKVDMSQFGY
jgi:hypothetical protein